MEMSLTGHNKRNMDMRDRYDFVLNRSTQREQFLRLLIKLIGNCELRGLRLIVENPWSMQTYLKNGFIKTPALIDNDRSLRGDYFKKPTAYWYVNCVPTYGLSLRKDKETKLINRMAHSSQAGICSEERSMISPDYARNFIHDFILGKPQKFSQLSLFAEFYNENIDDG